MNKAQLIDAVAEHTELPKNTVAKVLGGLLDVIPMAVAAGEQVSITGFGTFEAVYREARPGRNLQTGQSMQIPAGWAPRFKPGRAFKGLVGESKSLKTSVAA
jgi:Bacterial nucleoid DNA-binding protein